ncbi:MAG: hypothetical protein Q7T01_01540 [bacterium]|nr:hypothetical protein [bacterium]
MTKQRVLRAVLWAAAAALLVVLALRDVQLDRTVTVEADVVRNRTTPYLTAFGPPPRVARQPEQSEVFLVGEPVYVNLRLPRWFRRITVTLRYDNEHQVPFRVGVRTHPERWEFDVKTVDGGVVGDAVLVQHPDVVRAGLPGEVGVVQIPFTLQRAWQVERNVYRVIFSAPGVSPARPIRIRALSVTAERDPFCLGPWCL